MTTRSISLRTDEETLKKIDAYAGAEDRSRNWWINRAIASALEAEERWDDLIRERLREADEGKFATDEEVEAVFAKYIAPAG